MEPIAPGVSRLRLGEPEAVTPVMLRAKPPRLAGLAELGPGAPLPFAFESVTFRVTPRGCVVTLPLRADEDVYGFGLQLKSHCQTGLKRTLRVNADPVADTGDTHAPVPFYVSTAGYGILVDTARYATFYCGTHPTREAWAADPVSEHDQPIGFESYRRRRLRGARPMLIEVPAARGVDLYFFAGPALRDAVRRYVLFSGGGCLPPLWGLGFTYRTKMECTAGEVLEQAEGLRRSGIPCDVLGLEPGWHSHSYPCTYRWDPQRFPDPQALLARLHELGFHVNLWEHASVHPASPVREPLEPFLSDYPCNGGLVPDFSMPEARAIFADYHARELVERGVDAFKLDECDNSDFTPYAWSFPEATSFPSGLDGEQMHSLLGPLYQRTIESAFLRSGRRTMGQVRASHALAAPFPFALYSDLYDHRDFIRGMVNAGLSGLLWEPEVRESASSEELLRRLQTSVFSVQTMVNAWYLTRPPWFQVDMKRNNAGEPMADREWAEEACRRLIQWRMRLIPYLYAAFARYRLEGIPPVRPLVMDWPYEPELRGVDDAYLFGDSLLIAPLAAGQVSRNLTLPPGGWFDFWTGEKVAGGHAIELTPPAEVIPVFARNGALVPLARPVEHVTPDTVFELDILTFGDSCGPFTLYEDDGETFAFDSGAFNRLGLAWSATEGPTIQREGTWEGRRYEILRWIQGPLPPE